MVAGKFYPWKDKSQKSVKNCWSIPFVIYNLKTFLLTHNIIKRTTYLPTYMDTLEAVSCNGHFKRLFVSTIFWSYPTLPRNSLFDQVKESSLTSVNILLLCRFFSFSFAKFVLSEEMTCFDRAVFKNPSSFNDKGVTAFNPTFQSSFLIGIDYYNVHFRWPLRRIGCWAKQPNMNMFKI